MTGSTPLHMIYLDKRNEDACTDSIVVRVVRPMRIKEEESQHLVIVSPFRERVTGVFLLVFAIICSYPLVGFLPSFGGFLLVVPLILIYFGVRILMGRRIILDKSTDSVILEAPTLLLPRKKRIIPFTAVKGVEISYKKWLQGAWFGQGGFDNEGWQVSLDTGGKVVKMDHRPNRKDMLYLANKIGKFMGKELADHSAKSGPWFRYSP